MRSDAIPLLLSSCYSGFGGKRALRQTTSLLD